MGQGDAVDPTRLASTLDALHHALLTSTTPPITDLVGAVKASSDRMLPSFKAFLDDLNLHDLTRASSSFTPFPPDLAFERWSATVASIQRACDGYLAEYLGGDELAQAKIAALRALLRDPSPDVMGAMGRGADENAHSDALRWFLDPLSAPTIAPAMLGALAKKLDRCGPPVRPRSSRGHAGSVPTWEQLIGPSPWVRVRREYSLGQGTPLEGTEADRIDLALFGLDWVIVIENKVRALEHDGQTETYWRWLDAQDVRFIGGIFLSPSGTPARCTEFASMSWVDMLSCILEGPALGEISAKERAVLASYLHTISNHILRRELRPLSREAP